MSIVYLAGKTGVEATEHACGRDWRAEIIQDEQYSPKGFCLEARYWPQTMGTIVPGVRTSGPFIQNQHGCVVEPHRGVSSEDVWEACIRAIMRADWVFADLSDSSCHGTLVEIGFAAAKGKIIYCWKPDREVWFAAMHCCPVQGASRREAFQQACLMVLPCPGDSPIETAFAVAYAQLTGAYPRSQVQISQYRVDFLINRTVIELDGHAYHSSREQRTADAARDRYLQSQGYRVVRFTGSEVHRDAAACAKQALELSR